MERVLLQKKKNAKMSAISEILKHFLVRPVISFGKGMCCLEITGTKINVQLATYIAEFLEHEMDVMWSQAKKEYHFEGLRAKNSFFIGMARGFDQKMKDSKRSFSTDEQAALVVVEKSLDQKINQIYGRLSHTRTSSQIDEVAGAAGLIQGRNLTIRQGVTGTLKNLYLSYSKS